MKKLLSILTLIILHQSVFSQAGNLDTTFGSDGIVTKFPDGGYGQDIAIQSDGKIVVGGEISSDGFIVIRYNEDGSIDKSFGVNGVAKTIVGLGYNQDERLVLQADGKIVVGGLCANFDGYWNGALVRFNTDGTLDNTFGTGGKVIYHFTDPHLFSNQVYNLTVTADQKIITVGGSGTTSDATGFALARFNSNGSLDYTFGTNGIVITYIGYEFAEADCIGIQNDGKLVVGGYTYTGADGSSTFALARYYPDGSLDYSWSGDGKDTIYFYNHQLYYGFANATDLLIQVDGKIIIVGNSGSEQDSIVYTSIARYNVDGTFDNSFGIGGKKLIAVPGYKESRAYSVTEQSDGKIIIGGECGYPDFPNPPPNTMLMRLLQNGDLDDSFGSNGIVDSLPEFSAAILSLAMDQQQRICAVGPSDSGITVMRFLSGRKLVVPNIQSPASSMLVYPNPISNSVFLHYTLLNDEQVTISLYSASGIMVQVFKKDELQNAGDHYEFLQFDSSLPAGDYFLSFTNNLERQVMKIVMTR